MNKAILAVDMPKCCNECPIEETDTIYCQIFDTKADYRGHDPEKERPDWCPLRPINTNIVKALRCLGSKDQYNYCYMNVYNRNRGDNPEMSCQGTIRTISCPYHQGEYDTDFGSDGCQKLLNELADMLEGKESQDGEIDNK